jgi:hypothetical protein
MASDRQIEANRANSLKSTGPQTSEGKAVSSRNGLRHGLLSETIVLADESLERFNFLLANLRHKYLPRDVVESSLVENMAVARWRQMRVWAMEKAGLVQQMEKQDAGNDTTELDAPTRAVSAFRTLSDESRLLDLMGRYESRFERQFNRALDRLERLKKEK